MNGRPGVLFVSPDANRIFVLDEDAEWLTILSLSKFQVLRWIDLSRQRAPGRFFMALRGETLYCRGPSNGILLFDSATERFRGVLECGGTPVDMAVLPGGRQTQVTVSSGEAGAVELLEAGLGRPVDRLELPLRPVEDSLAVSQDGLLGAAILHAGREETRLACWALDPLRLLFVSPMAAGARSLAFSPEGRRLCAACRGESEISVVSVITGNDTQHLRMAGRPFQVRTEPRGRTVWALCESLGSLAIVDAARGTVTASLPLQGVKDPGSRMAFSPEGKLAVVPAGEGVALLNSDPGGSRYGRVEDRLELGRNVSSAAWSPLGDEVFAIDADSGNVLALGVDRGDVTMDDTSQYLDAGPWKAARPEGGGSIPSNPLFPP